MTNVCIAQVAPRWGSSTVCRPFNAEKVLQGVQMTPVDRMHCHALSLRTRTHVLAVLMSLVHTDAAIMT
jgi:hypothetical protein